MKIVKICVLLLGIMSVSAADASSFLNSSEKSNIHLKENNLGPTNPGSADNY